MDEKGAASCTAKGQGKGIVVSGFLTPGGRLQVPEHITNDMLYNSALYPQWPTANHDGMQWFI